MSGALARPRPPQQAKLLWIHGWGLSTEVWRPLAEALPMFTHRYVSFGACEPADDLREAVRAPLRQEPDGPWHVVGWSLGGMLAIELLAGLAAGSGQWAGLPRIESALLVGTTLSFADETGEAGWPPRVLARMRRRLAQAPEETLLAFLGQLDAGPASPGEPPLAEKLWQQLAAAPGFTPAGLDAGLAYLEAADLAPQWARIAALPAAERPRLLWLHGANDRVCPRAAMERARALFGSGLRTALIPDAGHAPFLSHPEAWREEVNAWYEAITHDGWGSGE
ncbi:alpha/beta fold hydrolase [Paenibacillus dendritiformis]|uniref:alpha/beta fold hydrolase n=1 Tax=Paenibacillus dendritiformis TaxID=130049 RepID=UPI000DAA73D6|nr:alpha/beta fold hydrolase [Paenibacillus dendritiformis]PZM63782.1 alpha/beta hydrolase [Paenibacillus dendritiformis]